MGRKSKRNKAKETVTEEDVSPKYRVKASSLTSKTEPLLTREEGTVPKVWYTNKAWQKMKTAIAICPMEVGWLGTVDAVAGGYLVTDIHVPKQVVNGTETDISAEALADLVHELDYPENLFYWGHSHVNMGVSPSHQDEMQTSEYLEHNDVFIRGIYNKTGTSKVDVFDMVAGMQYQSVNNGLLVDPLPTAEMESFEAMVKENVQKRTYQHPKSSGVGDQRGGSNGRGNFRESSVGKTDGAGGNYSLGSVYKNPFIVMEDK